MKNNDYILIVEDSRTQAAQIESVLRQLGYPVMVADSGSQALAYLENRKPAIVVADILMPEMDGYQLCKTIKANHKLRQVPVLLLTRLSDPKEIIKGLESGADDFIVKPFNEELLLARIRAILSVRYREVIDARHVNILVVEDSPTQAEQLKYLLEEYGYTVTIAGNGKEGLEAARRIRPNLIISDILMPVMNGYEMADEIKKDEALKKTPVILITLLQDREEIARNASVVADGFFTKPYDDNYLLSKIDSLISSSRDEEHGELEGLDVSFAGEKYSITSGRRQILTFLLSTYENSVQQNRDLILMQRELQFINEQLEERVKERTAQLEEGKKKLETIIDTSDDIIFLKDNDLRYKIANKALGRLLNMKPQDIIGKTDFDIFPKESAEGCRSSDEKVLGSDKPVDMEEWVMGRWFHVVKKKVKDTEGNISGIVAVIRDITEHKKIEEEYIRASKLDSLSILAGGLAHDFNNLLTGILGNASLALELCSPGEKIHKRLTELENAALRAQDLTQQLLTFAKGGAPIKRTVSVSGLIRDSVEFVLRGSSIRCDFSIADDLSPVEIDEGQMVQVIHNLVINAEQAMPEGATIAVSAENIDSRDTIPGRDGKYIMITVRDSGMGIPEENISKIFDPYFTTKDSGSGLGLATVYSIIKNHDGHIGVESEPGVGTTFRIYLPASEKEVVQKPLIEDIPFSGRGKILVMDDEAIVRSLAEAVLEELGYDVELSKDGNEAIELYKKARGSDHPFDAVILDLTVPGGLGGKEVIKRLLEIDPDVKAIVSSGYSADSAMSEYKKYGFSAVIAKPYKVADMNKTLQKVLQG